MLFFLGSSRVGVLLDHEPESSFQRSSLDVLGSLWEQVTELLKLGLGDAHENNVWHWLSSTVLLVLVRVGKGSEHNVRF
jgi:hypothetical protein